MKCPNCNAENMQDYMFCTNCGAKLNPNVDNTDTYTISNSGMDQLIASVEPAPMVEQPMPAVEPTPAVEQPILAVEPTPVVEQPIPAVEPTPVVEQPIPAVDPTPVVEQPIPAVEPTPVVEQPIPAVEPTSVVEQTIPAVEPAPVVEQPIPAVEPAPVVEQPIPAVEPTPVVEQPIPAVEPTPVVEQPIPAVEPTPVVEQPINVNNNVTKNIKKNNKKSFIIILLSIILVGLAICGYFYLNNGSKSSNKSVDTSKVFDPDKPIIVKKDGKYGYIDADGKVLIDTKYDYAYQFVDGYAVVMTEVDNSDSYYDSKYEIIDKTGKVFMSVESYYPPKYYEESGLWLINNKLYNSKFSSLFDENISVSSEESGFFTYSDYTNDRSGIINSEGKVIFSTEGTGISLSVSENENESDDVYASISYVFGEKNSSVISLKTGKVIYTDSNSKKLYSEDNGIFYYYTDDDLYDGDTIYLYFANGELLYKSEEGLYDLSVYDFDNNILELNYGYNYDTLGKNSRYEYYDVKNKKMLTEAPKKQSDSDDTKNKIEQQYGYKIYSSGWKYGIMANNTVVIDTDYDQIQFVDVILYDYIKSQKGQKLVLLTKGSSKVLMDLKNKKELITFEDSYVTYYEDSTFIKSRAYIGSDESIFVLYNVLTGESKTFENVEDITVYSNYIIVNYGTKKVYYNTKLKEIYTVEE